MIPYEGCRIYGPYSRKEDNRQHIIVIFPDGKKKTVSYPRYIVEMNLGRYLTSNEEVHHIDNDETNNATFNLVAIPKGLHKSLAKGSKYEEYVDVICIQCGKEFKLDRKQQASRNSSENKNKLGPFCSKSCSGKYGTLIQAIK